MLITGRNFFLVITFIMLFFCEIGIADNFFDSIIGSDDNTQKTQQSNDMMKDDMDIQKRTTEKEQVPYNEISGQSKETFSAYPEKENMNQPISPETPISYSLSKDGKKLFIFDILNMKKLQTYQLDEQVNLMNISLTNQECPEESNFLLINYRKKIVIYNIRKPNKKQFIDDVNRLKNQEMAYYESNFSNKLNIIYLNDKCLIYKKLNENLNIEFQDKRSIFNQNKIDKNNNIITRKIHKLLLTESNGIIVAYTDKISKNTYLLKFKVDRKKIKKYNKLRIDDNLTDLRMLFTRNTQEHLIIVLTNNKNKTFSMYAWRHNKFWNSTSNTQPYRVSGQVKVEPLVFNTESNNKQFKSDNYLAVISESGSTANLSYFQLNPYKSGKDIFFLKHSEKIDIQVDNVFFNLISPYAALSNYIILLNSNITIYQNELTINHQWKLNKKPIFSYRLPSRDKYQFYVRSNPHLFDRQNHEDYYLIITGQTESLDDNYFNEDLEEITSWVLKIQVDQPINDPVNMNFLETQ